MRFFANYFIFLSISFFLAFVTSSDLPLTEDPTACEELAVTAGFKYPTIDEIAPLETFAASGSKQNFSC